MLLDTLAYNSSGTPLLADVMARLPTIGMTEVRLQVQTTTFLADFATSYPRSCCLVQAAPVTYRQEAKDYGLG